MAVWSIDQIQWDKFDPSLVDTRSVLLAKGAALVEFNAADYVQYLTNVFRDDAELCEAIRKWGNEERQHGEALARWAKLADPTYDFEKSFQKFTSIYRIQVDAQTSYRGSRAQELVARCLVETGTSTYYSALADSSQEPVFKQICKYISADEIHHYKLFYKHLAKYQELDHLSRFARIKTAVQRSIEVEDEELSLAFACGNYPDRDIQKSDFKQYAKEFLGITYDLYRRPHIAKATKLMMNAAGIPSKPWVTSSMTSLIAGVVSYRQRAMRTSISSR